MTSTVLPVYRSHPFEKKAKVVFVNRWSSFNIFNTLNQILRDNLVFTSRLPLYKYGFCTKVIFVHKRNFYPSVLCTQVVFVQSDLEHRRIQHTSVLCTHKFFVHMRILYTITWSLYTSSRSFYTGGPNSLGSLYICGIIQNKRCYRLIHLICFLNMSYPFNLFIYFGCS